MDYYFVSLQEFEEMIAAGELIEYAVVYDQYKGIPKAQVRAFASRKDVVLRVDVQGAAKLQSLFPQALMIFLVPSNEEEWLHRLQNRNTETPENLVLRLETARRELDSLRFDYVVINAENRLEEAVDTASLPSSRRNTTVSVTARFACEQQLPSQKKDLPTAHPPPQVPVHWSFLPQAWSPMC